MGAALVTGAIYDNNIVWLVLCPCPYTYIGAPKHNNTKRRKRISKALMQFYVCNIYLSAKRVKEKVATEYTHFEHGCGEV